MIKKFFLLPLFLIPSHLFAYAHWEGFCQQGGQKVVTNSAQSTTQVQQSYPQATLTVYITGSSPLTKATIYSDNNGTPLGNPLTCSKTGYYSFYSNTLTVDLAFSGTGISAPYTIGGVQGQAPLAIISDLDPTASLATLCARATALSETMGLTQHWLSVTPQTLGCPILELSGSIQPSSGASSSMPIIIGGIFQAGRYKVFDLSLSSAGSVQFAAPAPTCFPEWFGATVVATGGSSDTLLAPITACYDSLPAIPTSNGTTTGEISLQNTGTSTYLISNTIQHSSRVRLKGGAPYNTYISPTTGFAPVASGTYMLSIINSNGSGNANNDFGADLEDLTFYANQNGNGYLGGLNLGLSTGSVIRNVNVVTGGVAFNIGGGTGSGPNADNIIFDNLSCYLSAVSMDPWPVCVQYPVNSSVNSTHSHKYTNLAIINSTNPAAAGAQTPAINIGVSSANISIDSSKCENTQWCLSIGSSSTNIEVSIKADCANHGTSCPLTSWPYVAMISPSAFNVHVKLVQQGYANTVVFADPRFASTALALNYQTIDPGGYIQKVTTNGTTSSAQSLSWNETPTSTTSDGGVTWTNEGLAVACAPGIVNGPCIGASGAANSSDNTVYSAECWEFGCLTGNQNAGNILMNIQGQINAATFATGNLNMFTGGAGSPASFIRSINTSANASARCQQMTFSDQANSNSSFDLFFAQGDCSTGKQIALLVGTNNGATFSGYDIVLDYNQTMGTAIGGALKVFGAPVMSALPTSAGSGGLYVCVDTTGALYKKSSCP